DYECCLPWSGYSCMPQSDGQTVRPLPSEVRHQPFVDNRFIGLILLVLQESQANFQAKMADRPASQVSSSCAEETTLPVAILAASRMASLTSPNSTFGADSTERTAFAERSGRTDSF